MLINNKHLAEINAPIQDINARVELLRGSTLEKICTCGDFLQDFAIEKTGEGKFFGFGICQKLIANFGDIDQELNITKEHTLDATFGVNGEFIYPYPRFYVQDVKRDEVSGLLTITAYDILFKAETFKVSDLALPTTYTLKTAAAACASILGVPLKFVNINETTFSTSFTIGDTEGSGVNFDGTESVRNMLNAIAEATQTIYYISNNWELVFRRLDKDGDADYTVEESMYYELFKHENRRLSAISHTTELGDNTATVGTNDGITQFVRNNPFWELRNDIGTLLAQAENNIAGLEINQFETDWSGNYLLEIGDKIDFVLDNGSTITTFVLDDTITYDGTIMGQMSWQYDENEGETETNPITIGEALNQTYARVDKVNKTIELVASDVNENTTKIASLVLTTENITAEVQRVESETDQAIANLQISAGEIAASVSRVEEYVDEAIDDIGDDVATLTKSVETKMTAEAVEIEINKVISNGTTKVDTGTGFTFNEEGLTIQKTEDGTVSEMKTQITEDGMTVYRSDEAVLIANNQGVKAENLRATTWLEVGGRSRFENYGSDRTGCFWIGG